jgi:hypothetical protein
MEEPMTTAKPVVIKYLSDDEMSVLRTCDFAALLIQLAHLAQFKRLVVDAAGLYPMLDGVLEYIRGQQQPAPPEGSARPLEILDIPSIMHQVHGGLCTILDCGGNINPDRLPIAVDAFVAVLGAEVQ